MSFERKKSMGSFAQVAGFLTIIFGIISLVIIWYYNNTVTKENFMFISVPISLGLGVFAIGLSISSDVKMDINSNENFLRIVDHFEDKRIELFQEIHYHNSYDKLIGSCWKFRRYAERALKLHEMANIEPENQSLLYEQIVQMTLMSDIPWGRRRRIQGRLVSIMRPQEIDNLSKVCKNCLFFDLNHEQKEQIWNFFTFIEPFR